MKELQELQLAKTEEQKEFWDKLQPVNRAATTDTYKRTMSASSNLFADNFAVYNLAARRALKEEGLNGRLVVAGLEKMLYPWFMNPITEKEVNRARNFFKNKAQVKKFPEKAWQAVLDNSGYFPVDVYGLPGGQTVLVKDGKHVPLLSVEGLGAIATHLEPQMTTMYAPIIEATKARAMYEATGAGFAEFGLRGIRTANDHPTRMMAVYTGGGFTLTSNDQAVYLFPELFKDIGTVGHEFGMAYQRGDKTLEEAQYEAMEAFVQANDKSALLPDTIDTIHSGLPAIRKLAEEYQDQGKVIMPRFDSGDVTAQAIYWRNQAHGLLTKNVIVEDGYTPTRARDTKQAYIDAGFDPNEVIVGAGGYFDKENTRDAISMAYKRAATMHDGVLEPSIKFSDDKGKESIPGQVRVYARDDTLIVAQAGELVEGELLTQKLVDNGRIIYNETLDQQRRRAEETWGKIKRVEYSPMTQKITETRRTERDAIIAQYEK